MKYFSQIKLLVAFSFTLLLSGCASCKYSFKDISPIPENVKTFRVNPIENKAQYVNTQLAQQLTEKAKQKIINTTRLRQTNSDDAHYDISGYISQYYTTTISITDKQASGNRLNVGFHLIFKNTLDQTKDFEADISRSYDFDGQLSLTQAEASLTPKIVTDLSDEIFNKIFSNW
jgi:outer membrane lipopolysaccharide assembly protein LptE/RlpB